MKDVFARFGDLIDIYMLNGKNFGYAKYASKEYADKAIMVSSSQMLRLVVTFQPWVASGIVKSILVWLVYIVYVNIKKITHHALSIKIICGWCSYVQTIFFNLLK